MAIIGMFALVAAAHAAEIKRYDFQGKPFVVVKGPLVTADVERFRTAVSGVTSGTVLMQSEGGSLYAGIEIGKTIRMRGLATWVSSHEGPCMSACAFAWVAGTPRMIDATAKIGFHAAYIWENGKPVMTGSGNALVGAYLRDIGLSDAAIFYATQARPESMKWLTKEDAAQIDLTIEYLNIMPSSNVSVEEDEKWAWALPQGLLPVPEIAPRLRATVDAGPTPTLTDLFRQSEGDGVAILYEEVLGGAPVATQGRVYWWTVSLPDGLAIQARMVFAAKRFTTELKMLPNRSDKLPASHMLELRFSGAFNLGARVHSVQRIAFKQTEQDRGNSLIAVPAKVTSDFHMIALNNDADARQVNMELMKTRSWIDIPAVLENDRRILLTFEKGPVGSQVFQRAFAEWQGSDGGGDHWIRAPGFFIAGDTIDFIGTKFPTIEQCRAGCKQASSCIAFSFSLNEQHCYLKRKITYAVPNPRYSSEYVHGLHVDFVK